MENAFFYSILSVLAVSLLSLVGVLFLGVKEKKLKTILIYLISFSTGALLGDAFLHLLPEIVEENGFKLTTSFSLLGGIAIFLVLEKVIHWHHCHADMPHEKHVHPFAYTNLVGDALHNFIDGIIIAAAYIVSLPAGIATTIAVILHEIPQEIGDFAVLLHAGFSKMKALLLNLASALLAVLGAALTFIASNSVENLQLYLIPIAAGGFIYIAGSDLIPELHKHSSKLSQSILQILAFLVGIAVMAALLLLE